MLTFDAPTHTYKYAGREVPHVTGILDIIDTLKHVDPKVLENARQEGVDMHRMIQLECADALDEERLPLWLRPRFRGWRRFRSDTGFVPTHSEQIVYHPLYGYAGTLDLRGTMRYQHVDIIAMIDLKRSFAAGRLIGLQTAAYDAALVAEHKVEPADRRFALRLRPEGDYRLEPFDRRDDFAMFLSCLNVLRLKESMNGN